MEDLENRKKILEETRKKLITEINYIRQDMQKLQKRSDECFIGIKEAEAQISLLTDLLKPQDGG